MTEEKSMTRDEALMWLNDHVDKNVNVALSVDTGGWSIHPIELQGFLKHAGGGFTPEHRDELVGNYAVGDDGGLDLSEIPDDAFSLWRKGRLEELRVRISDHAGIGITAPSMRLG